ESRVRELADGRIYTGKQALERKLIDEFGGLDDAVAHAGKLGGITGEPRVIDRQRNSFWESLFNPAGAATTERSLIATALRRLHLDQPVGFKYLYAP
ncbi:MAG: S49 family peptidase, partial [Chloroflexi bacterium]|nr:S49 family peptidase [Chloroflexota bacterium]